MQMRRAIILTAVATALTSVAPRALEQNAQSQSTTPMTVKAGDIAANPVQYYGKKVTVNAEVEDVLGAQVFLLDEDRLFAWPDLMVVAPKLTGPVPEDTNVTVVGTVQKYSSTTLRRDYDWNWWNDLDADIEMTFRDRPVIIADSVKSATGAELVRR
jgi:hypothetical protein